MAKRDDPGAQPAEMPPMEALADAIEIAKVLVCDQHTEGQLVLGVDRAARLSGAAFRCPCERCLDEPLVTASDLVALATELGAVALVLVTYVRLERLAPTPADVARFEGLDVECAGLGVELLDHVLMSGHRWCSIRELSAGPGASTTW